MRKTLDFKLSKYVLTYNTDRRLPRCSRHRESSQIWAQPRTKLTVSQTIITTAVPTIATRFNASEADYTWIGSAYLLAAAASTPTWGKFSDIWGRKPILLVANVVFLAGSLISALSTGIKMLLAGRAIQGIGGGGLIILANICISDLFSMRFVSFPVSAMPVTFH